MSPLSSAHGLNIAVFQDEQRQSTESQLGETLRSALPVRAEADNFHHWKRAALMLVALPVAIWLIMVFLG